MAAAARSLEDGRMEIEPCDVLCALTRHQRTAPAPALGDLGVDEGTKCDAIRRREWPG
jgi:hypothetical protein